MLKSFSQYIHNHHLFATNDTVLAAISGGADSVVMLHLLVKFGVQPIIVHCNFQLRGMDSDRDEEFVKALAEKHHLSFYSKKFDTTDYSKINGISIEMAARDLRYAWFNEICLHQNIGHIATAHHQNDQAETIILNLIRGTGLKGLRGILPKQGNLVRPLLFATKSQILGYASKKKLRFCTDHTNADVFIARNRIRHEVLPQLENINSSVVKTLCDEASRFGEMFQIYSQYLEVIKEDVLTGNDDQIRVDLRRIVKYNALSTLLFEIVKEYGFSSGQMDEIIKVAHAQSGKVIASATHNLYKDRDSVIIAPIKKIKNKTFRIVKPNGLKKHPMKFRFSLFDKPQDISKEKNICYLDAQKLKFPLILRKWHEGDFFYPLGMNKPKKLSNFFIDQKLSCVAKDAIWLLCSSNDIVWIVGHRIDDRYKVTSRTTHTWVCVWEKE